MIAHSIACMVFPTYFPRQTRIVSTEPVWLTPISKTMLQVTLGDDALMDSSNSEDRLLKSFENDLYDLVL